MPQQKQSDRQETQQRLAAILRGAFKGAPTPLKEIPKRNGGVRSLRARKSKRPAATKR